jgi:hypothetical protein
MQNVIGNVAAPNTVGTGPFWSDPNSDPRLQSWQISKLFGVEKYPIWWLSWPMSLGDTGLQMQQSEVRIRIGSQK